MGIIKTIGLWIFIACAAAGGMYGGYLLFGGTASATTPEPIAADVPAQTDQIDAAVICQSYVKQLSLNADKADFPYSKPIDNGESWRILWIQGSRAKLQNQFGAMIDTNVVCSVRKIDGSIDQLIIDGKKVI